MIYFFSNKAWENFDLAKNFTNLRVRLYIAVLNFDSDIVNSEIGVVNSRVIPTVFNSESTTVYYENEVSNSQIALRSC